LIIFSQNKSLNSEFKNELQLINQQIEAKEYDKALIDIGKLESNSNYILIDENRLSLSLLKAKVYDETNQKEKAINILLNGIDELNLRTNLSYLHIKYLFLIGDLFSRTKNYDRALFYYKEVLKKSQNIIDSSNILNSYSRMGYVFYKKEDLDSANYYYLKITQFPLKNTTEKEISKAYNSLGIIAGKNKNLILAEDYGRKFLEIKKLQKDTLKIAGALVNLGAIYYEKEEYNKAKRYYSNAYTLLENKKTNESMNILSQVLFSLAYVNEKLKYFEKAYSYLDRATDLTDSLTEASINQNISEIEAKYNLAKEAEKTTAEKNKRLRAQVFFYGSLVTFVIIMVIGYIFYRNYRLKQRNKLEQLENEMHTKIINATIDAKEKERKSIAETLHDNVSALLSSANLHLQATKAQLRKDAPKEITKAQTIVNEASVKIRDLSHELISSVLLKFGLAFAVHDMCQKYSNSEITLISDDNGVKRYDQDFEIKIHNIIEELINNILKHSKASNATIMLIHREDDMLGIRINDDGIGFDVKKAKQKDGLGLSHINARIKIMKGVFTIETSKDNGTSIFILVPIQFREEVA
jgi:signal transduction histidine kinase